MNQLQSLNESQRKRIDEIARELAEFGLGIFFPHAHDAEGNIISLAPNMAAYEEQLSVRFIAAKDVPVTAVEVGWRWSNGKLRACADCCTADVTAMKMAEGLSSAPHSSHSGA